MQLYNDYNTYLKTKYGCKVYRIGLDAGFTCPNRDGTKGAGGCIFCNAEGSRANYANPNETIEKQLANRIACLKASKGTTKFIAYFQAFTNTYAPPGELKSLYDRALAFSEIVGLSVGTRPDTVNAENARLLAGYMKHREVWLELGLQSIHDKTLEIIRRGHTFGDFLTALALAKRFGIPVSAHVILGLPHETRDDMIRTARTISNLKVDAVKIHLLHVLKGSPLERLHEEQRVKLLTREEYIEIVCDFLENLAPGIIVQRLTGEGTRSNHIAPEWALDKMGTIAGIKETLKKRGTVQGYRFNDK
ncbi:MAG: TIGR01212 family radical SAM protein [Candidatus Omnitrophota bacterium]